MPAIAFPQPASIALAALLAAASLTGCLGRKETIHIREDGSLAITHTFKGDPAEFDEGGDALPTGGPWTITDEDVPKDDGDGVEHVRTARAEFASAAAVPTTFASADDGGEALRFTTTLTPARGGEWYFERRYEPRAYRWRDTAFENAFPERLRKELEGKDPADLSDEVRVEALTKLLEFELAKCVHHLEGATRAIADRLRKSSPPSAAFLKARVAFEAWFETAWTRELLAGYLDANEAARQKLEDRFEAETKAKAASIGAELLGVDASMVAAAYAHERRVFAVSEDLQDERFEVRVTFPGAVTAHDGARLEADGRTVVFEFSGADLRDQAVVLRATAKGQ